MRPFPIAKARGIRRMFLMMKFEVPNQRPIIGHYGERVQSLVHAEELAELIQAVSKLHRTRSFASTDNERDIARLNLVEEIADVVICVEQMLEMYDIREDEVQGFIEEKCERQVARLK